MNEEFNPESLLLKLQEHLLRKGNQNKANTENLAKLAVIGRSIEKNMEVPMYGLLIDMIEDQQLVINGRSRKEYLQALSSVKEIREEE